MTAFIQQEVTQLTKMESKLNYNLLFSGLNRSPFEQLCMAMAAITQLSRVENEILDLAETTWNNLLNQIMLSFENKSKSDCVCQWWRQIFGELFSHHNHLAQKIRENSEFTISELVVGSDGEQYKKQCPKSSSSWSDPWLVNAFLSQIIIFHKQIVKIKDL